MVAGRSAPRALGPIRPTPVYNTMTVVAPARRASALRGLMPSKLRKVQVRFLTLPAAPTTRSRYSRDSACVSPVDSSATGQLRLLLYIPDRSKQHGRRLPLASMSQAVAMRLTRVSGRFGDVTQ